MAKARRNAHGGTTWTFESGPAAPLSAKLGELMVVFDHYAKTGSGADARFVMELLAYQAEALQEDAKSRQREIDALKKELAELKKEIVDLKDPPEITLDKAKPHKPKGL